MQISISNQWDKPRPEERGSVRQTQGRRFLLMIPLILALTFICMAVIFTIQEGNSLTAEPASGKSGMLDNAVQAEGNLYIVKHQDTLWTIAADHYPDSDRETAIHLIQKANSLESTTLHAGQTLLLP